MNLSPEFLRELGVQQVVAMDLPATLINGIICTAKRLEYETLDDVRNSEWFNLHRTTGVLLIYVAKDQTDNFTIHLFDIENHRGRVMAVSEEQQKQVA